MHTSCNNPDYNGGYELFATIGSWVYPQVNFTGHDFDPMANDNDRVRDEDKVAAYLSTGYFASPESVNDGSFDNHDFFDTTLAPLTVEVAGGLCNIPLGTSVVKVNLEGCDSALYEQRFTQNGYTGSCKFLVKSNFFPRNTHHI